MKKEVKKIKKIINKIKDNRILNIVYSIVKTVCTIILICMLLIIVVQRVTKNNFAVGGVRIFAIVSGSMVPKYEIGDILISKSVNLSEINVGDDVTYQGTKGDMAGLIVTHQVVNKRNDGSSYYFITKGLANPIADPEINGSQIFGKVIYKTVLFSFLCRLMNNMITYYLLFAVVALMVSFQVVKIIYDKEDDDDASKGQKE